MTAAIAHLRQPSLRVRPARALMVLALVLPVPLCAALGLSLPLPATVERIAAKLVPFANTAALASKEEQLLGTRGSIVLTAGELAAQRGTTSDSTGPLTTSNPRNGPTDGAPGVRVDGPATATESGPVGTLMTTTAATAAATATATTVATAESGSSPPAQAEPSSSPISPGGTTSTPDTGTTPTNDGTPSVVDTVTSAPSTVVETASNTVTTATQTVTAAVGAGSAVVNGTVGPVLPP
jgi:hypothetical protein